MSSSLSTVVLPQIACQCHEQPGRRFGGEGVGIILLSEPKT